MVHFLKMLLSCVIIEDIYIWLKNFISHLRKKLKNSKVIFETPIFILIAALIHIYLYFTDLMSFYNSIAAHQIGESNRTLF